MLSSDLSSICCRHVTAIRLNQGILGRIIYNSDLRGRQKLKCKKFSAECASKCAMNKDRLFVCVVHFIAFSISLFDAKDLIYKVKRKYKSHHTILILQCSQILFTANLLTDKSPSYNSLKG